MNILLVYPMYPDTFWSFKHALKFVSKKASFPPLGLVTVAAMLPSEMIYGKKFELYNDTVIGFGVDGQEIVRTTIEEPIHIRDPKHYNSI